MLTRRISLLSLPAFLAACSLDFSNSAVTLDQVKQYTDDVVDAVSAAANTYLVQKPSQVLQDAVQQLQAARQAVDQATAPANAKAAVDEALSFLDTIVPMVAPFLGAAGPYVPLALAVLHAFIHNLSLPPNAPPTPPAQLHRAAEAYRMHRH